ncbi:MAG: hypothetical protein WCP24_00720 [bacterium]
MKNSQKGFVAPLLIVIAVLVIGSGIFYSYKKNNWGCALDSQGIKYYVLKSDLNVYKDKIESYQGSQFTNDRSMIDELRNKNVVYAEDSNNCYGKHTYKIKNNSELTAVDLKVFNEYLSSEKFNKNLCTDGALISQSGNSPFFINYNFCRI